MRRSVVIGFFLAAVSSGLVIIQAKGDDWPTLPDWLIRRKADPVGPNSLFQMARSLDDVEEKIRDDGSSRSSSPTSGASRA